MNDNRLEENLGRLAALRPELRQRREGIFGSLR